MNRAWKGRRQFARRWGERAHGAGRAVLLCRHEVKQGRGMFRVSVVTAGAMGEFS